MTKLEVPFFARLLESQETELHVRTDVKAGAPEIRPPDVTQKYPSDDDEGGGGETS